MKQTTCTQVPKDVTGACLNTSYSSQCKEALRGWWEHFCTRTSSSVAHRDFNLDVALQALYNMYKFQKEIRGEKSVCMHMCFVREDEKNAAKAGCCVAKPPQ